MPVNYSAHLFDINKHDTQILWNFTAWSCCGKPQTHIHCARECEENGGTH